MIEPKQTVKIKSPYFAQLAAMLKAECIGCTQWNPETTKQFADNRFYFKAKPIEGSKETIIIWRIFIMVNEIEIQCDEKEIHLRKGFKIVIKDGQAKIVIS